MMIRLIFFFTTLLISLVIFLLKMPVKRQRDGSILGIYCPEQAAKDAEVLKIQQSYQQKNLFWLLGCFMLSLPLLYPTPFVSLIFLWLVLWMLIVMVSQLWIYAYHEKKLKKVKRQRGWYIRSESSVYVDTIMSQSARPTLPSKIFFLLGAVMIGLPLLVFTPFLGLSALTAADPDIPLITWVCFGISLMIFILSLLSMRYIRSKGSKTYFQDSLKNIQVNSTIKTQWMLFTLIITYISLFAIGLFPILYALQISMGIIIGWMVFFSMLPSALTIGLYVYQQKFLSKIETSELGAFIPVSGEDFWHFGVFYYNPRLKKTLVPKRYGIGTTLNLASPMGKIISAVSAFLFLLLFIPLLILLPMDDFTPPRTILSPNALTIHSVLYQTTVPYDSIETVSMFDGDLNIRLKRNGSATGLYSRGYFKTEAFGNSVLYIFNDSKPYVVIQRKQFSDKASEPVIYSGMTSADTKAFYEALKIKLLSKSRFTQLP